MAEIRINSCDQCSNYDELLAVVAWVDANVATGYKRVRNVFVGQKEFNVFESPRYDELTSCNGEFVVTRVQ